MKEAAVAQVHTHYDNLKVARNAPPEVIRAAYRVLTQKYHPDKHAGSSEATRVMRIVNEAYETLMDPGKRAEHDAWISREEATEAARAPSSPASAPSPSAPAGASSSQSSSPEFE